VSLSLADCIHLDAADPAHTDLAAAAECFDPGTPGTLYFDANSIGPMPRSAPQKMQSVLHAGWAQARRRSWNELDWLAQPRALGASIAHLIGAEADDVRVGDSTSVNQYKLLRYALSVAAPRRVIVLERQVFPSNRYVAECIAHDRLADLRFISDISELPAALAPGDVAVVALSHVDYRSSTRLDMAALAPMMEQAGALSLWDLSHSAGAVAVALRACKADLAVGCGYKYLCGGPGAPAFVYVHPRWADAAWPAIGGWMGHADTFAFEPDYRPGQGLDRLLVGTPAALANVAFSAAAEIWRGVDPQAMDSRHRSLTNTLIALFEEQCGDSGLRLSSPRDHAQRGGHVALQFAGAAPLAQALVAHGVVVSSRKPDALRWGVHPLTTTHRQLWQAVQILRDLLQSGAWQDPRFAQASV
jgi:kynureninase